MWKGMAMELVAVIGIIWFWGGLLIAAPYFWFKRTDDSQAPIERRLSAAGLGLIWPIILVKHLVHKGQDSTDQGADRARTESE